MNVGILVRHMQSVKVIGSKIFVFPPVHELIQIKPRTCAVMRAKENRFAFGLTIHHMVVFMCG
ncbi:unnamed protein product [Periconia digitata]|uniref:Uncharacterized protein n=1 Tax=Periconia digitata TaxID=1303443 RepID=A0A9W4UHG6_9PLEO|nr:unnamed protein product [Periconia digitata]